MDKTIPIPLKISQVLPLRETGKTPLFWPSEEGYKCPVCGATGEALYWSEYRGMLWCYTCERDYPSCLCLPVSEIDRALEIFLRTVRDAIKAAPARDGGQERV